MTTQPPNLFDEIAEQAVLAACIADKKTYPLVGFLKDDDFFLVRHTYIWRAMNKIAARKEPIDLMTVRAELTAMGQLESIGGVSYLTSLLATVHRVEHVEVYARLVQRYHVRRMVIAQADEMKRRAYDLDIETPALVGEWDKSAIQFRQGNLTFRKSWGDLINEQFATIENKIQNPNVAYGVPSGLRDIDSHFSGFQRSHWIVLAARPGMGKTALMLTMALNAAKMGKRIGIFSQEMSAAQLAERIAAIESMIPLKTIINGQMSPMEYSRYTEAARRLHDLKSRLFIDDTPGISMSQMRSTAYEWANEYGLDMVMQDYIGKMTTPGWRGERVQEVSQLARQCKDLAKEMNIPVLSLSQLSREVEKRQDKRPILSDLRESGDIEQEADIVMFLYRDVYYNEATEFPHQADVMVSKNRHGSTGVISLYFDAPLTRFVTGSMRQVDIVERSGNGHHV